MEYLKNLGFTDSDIVKIKDNNYHYILDNLEINSKNVVNIINYLFEIGITKDAIVDILACQVNLFFKTKKEIQTSFDEYEIDTVVKSLNFDANNVELIDFV